LFVDVDLGVGVFDQKVESISTFDRLDLFTQQFVLGAECKRVLQLFETLRVAVAITDVRELRTDLFLDCVEIFYCFRAYATVRGLSCSPIAADDQPTQTDH